MYRTITIDLLIIYYMYRMYRTIDTFLLFKLLKLLHILTKKRARGDVITYYVVCKYMITT